MKLDRRGLIATIVYHTLLILLLVFAGLTFPDPPPEEAGILVNFGTDDTGFGAFEPKGDDQQAGEPDQPVVNQAEEIAEEAYTPPVQTPVDQTQDVEEVKVKEVPKPTPEEIQRQKEETERIQREKVERDRIEKERLEKERIEREKQAQAEKLNNLGKNAFGNQGVGETGGSQGVTEGSGNQGDINGSPDADRYGTGGGLGEGISFGGLGSRKAMGNLPKPNMAGCEITQRIEVKVEIQVDQEGNVISAIVQSATYQDNCIWTMVVEAAKKSRFSVDRNANYRQTGWIRYIIVP
ncbi:MAG: cell envelope integrity protein TolA [Bacteroidales bacterium]